MTKRRTSIKKRRLKSANQNLSVIKDINSSENVVSKVNNTALIDKSESSFFVRFSNLVTSTIQDLLVPRIFLVLSFGIILDLLSEYLKYSKTESIVLVPTLISTINIIGIGFIISSIVMIGLNVISPFLVEKFSNILTLKSSKSSFEQSAEDSEIYHEYFMEISELNKKMEKEQKEIERIKSETYQIAYETQEVLSILRSKVGIN